MRCVKCGKQLRNEWNYCPFCGVRVERNALLNAVNKVIKGFFKDGRFTIKLRVGGSPQRIQQQVIKLPDNVVEPESTISEVGDGLIISFKLPGVKSMNNISIRIIGESLEVRAVAGSTGYFKIIGLPGHYRIINKEFGSDTLKVRLSAL